MIGFVSTELPSSGSRSDVDLGDAGRLDKELDYVGGKAAVYTNDQPLIRASPLVLIGCASSTRPRMPSRRQMSRRDRDDAGLARTLHQFRWWA